MICTTREEIAQQVKHLRTNKPHPINSSQINGENVAPDSLDFGGDSYEAVEAMDAICKTLTACIESTTEMIVLVAKCARNTIESYITYQDESGNFSWGTNGEEQFCSEIDSHAFAVIEMANEAEDLQRLKETERLDRDFLEWLRTCSYNNEKSLIDLT